VDNSVTLWNRFEQLPRPSVQGRYCVEAGGESYRIGRTFADHPVVLISFAEGSESGAARRLPNLWYTPPETLDLHAIDGRQYQARLAVLECRTGEPMLCQYFFRIAETVLLGALDGGTEQVFESALDALITLFRSLQRPGTRSLQGLWAELALVGWSKDPAAAIASWHSSPRSLHDFVAGDCRLEVKSTSKAIREHHFLLDQLAALPGGNTVIASMLLVEADDGISLFNLLEEVSFRVKYDRGARSRLEAIVVESLGSSWPEATGTRFRRELARESLRLYRANDVPRVPQPLPPEVKDVEFVADLSSSRPLEIADARMLGSLFDQLLPSVASAVEGA